MPKKLTKEIFIKRAKEIHGNKYNYEQIEYINTKQKVKIFCNTCKEFFWQTPDHHLTGSGCSICINGPKDLKHFIKKAKKIHGNKYSYDESVYIDSYTKIKIYCKKCKTFFYQRPDGHLNRKGCPFCAKNQKLTTVEFIKRAMRIHKNNYDYSCVEYNGMEKPVKIICKRCGKILNQLPANHLKGKGCPCCNKSKGENEIKECLIRANIKFEFQKRFSDCKDKQPLPFDFYLEDYNTCIEFQGKQHYEPDFYISMYKSKEKGLNAFNLQQKRDQIKRNYCLLNKIRLIEIRYDENIENRLRIELVKYV